MNVVMRGSRVMTSASIQNKIEKINPDLQFKRLPPYFPFANLIESMFSVMKKNYIKHHQHAPAG